MCGAGSKSYADYMVDAMANSWSANLGIDGYCEDVSCSATHGALPTPCTFH